MDNNNLYGTDNNNASDNNNTAGSNANPYESPVQTDNNMSNNTYQQNYSTQPYQQNYNQQNYNQQPYGQQTYYSNVQEEPERASGLAIASMVCGIVSIVICCAWYLAAPLGIAAIALGIINNVKKLGGKGMAISGIITGSFGLLLAIGWFVVYLLSL
ncbi:MAG: DUF4190 domain-containing protein [Clostridiales bacterium]|nr:DUF4190 domain-containing protein [Clostridiales bacterium]